MRDGFDSHILLLAFILGLFLVSIAIQLGGIF